MLAKLMIKIVLIVALSGCAVSNDPRQGGFLGGLHGLTSGTYDKRLQQSREELNHQQTINTGLKEESVKQEKVSQEWEIKLASEQQRLDEMKKSLSSLETDVNRLKAKSAKQKSEVNVLKNKIKDQVRRLKSQQTALNELDRTGENATATEQYRILEQERNRLAEEYSRLMEHTKALSDASK